MYKINNCYIMYHNYYINCLFNKYMFNNYMFLQIISYHLYFNLLPIILNIHVHISEIYYTMFSFFLLFNLFDLIGRTMVGIVKWVSYVIMAL